MGLQAKQATTAKPRKKVDKVKKCKCCRKSFRPDVANEEFCKPECKSTRQAADKRKALEASRLERFMKSAFAYWMATEAQRAGLLDVFCGHTVESLLELYGVYKYWLRANGLGNDAKLYAIAHVHPVKPKEGDYIGLLHAENLFVCPELPNRQHGNNYFGQGKSIHRSQTSAANFVSEDESRKGIIRRIVRYLGEDVITEFAKKARIQPTQRIKRLMHLELFLDELGLSLEQLHDCSTAKLGQLQSQLTGKKEFVRAGGSYDPLCVMRDELERHAKFRPDGIEEVAELAAIFYRQQCASQNVNGNIPEPVASKIAIHMWNVLHGKEADADYVQTLMKPHLKEIEEVYF
ncbi:hypothetical protein [Pseudomonas sp. BN411]|uniref:hypothetical protein n=1 Tax=Pseudomonas sp. BN411 TaxID=2567887 RepID=UPI002457567E|nr:hypothetical protein [Pseudomonas sp. BN411]MDH4562149.1 hypothetical protein [Pseudomonas sp. BN411]